MSGSVKLNKLNKMYNYDQAGELRRLVIEKDREVKTNSQLHTVAVLSGKGGVGKSNIAASLAFALADFGKRVVLVDADLGLANLDILCGVKNARFNIAHLLEGSRGLSEILVHFKTSERAERLHGSVSLLPGGYGIKEIADLDEFAMERLFSALSSLDEIADYLIMDAGAGIHRGALSFAYASEVTIVITTPEPTSVRDAYGVIKSLGSMVSHPGLMLVVNMVESSREAQEVAERIRLATMQFLGNAPSFLGYVVRDEVIERAVKACRVFYRTDAQSKAGICVRNLAGQLLRKFEGADIEALKLPEGEAGGVSGFLERLAARIFDRK